MAEDNEDNQNIIDDDGATVTDQAAASDGKSAAAVDNEPSKQQESVKADCDLFVGEVHEELSEQDVFAGNEEFYKALQSTTHTSATTPVTGLLKLPSGSIRHFTTPQKILFVIIGLIAVPTFWGLLHTSMRPQLAEPAKPPVASQPPQRQQTTAIQQPQPALLPAEPVSLEIARNLYLQNNYKKAYTVYSLLRQNLPETDTAMPLKDFLELKMALCLKKDGDLDRAHGLLRNLLQSSCPIVKLTANYHLCFIEMQKKQFINARTRAYQAIALLEAVNQNDSWTQAMLRDCHFLAAEAITRNILSLCDADKELPAELWTHSRQVDPFVGLDQAQLKTFLKSGSEKLGKALLGPQIRNVAADSRTSSRWFANCLGASIEELISRFAVEAGFDVHWALIGTPSLEETSNLARKRPVTLYLPAATNQQMITIAAGCAGLLAHLDEKSVINIYDPADYTSLSKHISLLSDEAVSLWKRFLLRFYDDKRIPNAHFALALLHARRDQITQAVAEFKLLANKFSSSPLAPWALLHSSKFKTGLRNYLGARDDLTQLIDLHADSEIAGKACLYLADATMQAQIYDEAAELYSKVYNIGLTTQLQAKAALGAGRCFFEKKDYKSAVKWLLRCTNRIKDPTNNQLYSAYLLLGRANFALENYHQACDAFQYALQGPLSKEDYTQTALAIAKGYMKQTDFIKALSILENMHSAVFSQKESLGILLLKSRIYREIGLVDKAVLLLTEKAEYITDSQLKAQISLELTDCYIAHEDWQLAYKNLVQILVFVEPGPLAHQVACKLAEICLQTGKNSRAISVCLQLLELRPSEQMRLKTLNLLAKAYSRQKNYDKAALALLGHWKDTDITDEDKTSEQPASTGKLITANRLKTKR